MYFQGALLGVSAITFFIFGVMIGSIGKLPDSSTDDGLVQLSGIVSWENKGADVPDAGAVAILLPETPLDISRQNPDPIRPDQFQPLENPTIDMIVRLGGSIVRTNIDGRFELTAAPGKYALLVVSKAVTRSTGEKLTREQVALLSQYFLPVENLILEQQYYWEDLDLKDGPIARDKIHFN